VALVLVIFEIKDGYGEVYVPLSLCWLQTLWALW